MYTLLITGEVAPTCNIGAYVAHYTTSEVATVEEASCISLFSSIVIELSTRCLYSFPL